MRRGNLKPREAERRGAPCTKKVFRCAPGPFAIRTDGAKVRCPCGTTVGQTYQFDLFNAERHPSGSNFTITTSMTFVDCGVDPMTVR